MQTIAIIPAPAGSKRLPNKNVLEFGKIPLLAHSIFYAQQNSKIIDQVYVSTDSEKIANIATQFGTKVIYRPTEISGDNEATVSALAHVLENIETVDNVILLQPTNPLRPKDLLDIAYAKFIGGNHDSLFTVSRNHHKLGTITNQKFKPYNYAIGQRSQDLEPLFFENGLLYITKASLIKQQIIISENAFPFEVDHIFANIDIDTQQDFDFAQLILEKYGLNL
jgi:N-acylneuraminate cytidylyltransferase